MNWKNKIDIKGGDLTFGQRIELGKLLTSGMEEFDLFKAVFKCLYNEEPSPMKIAPQMKKYLLHLEEIIEGIIFWIEKEQTLLKYSPSAEEQRAGIQNMADKIGEFGTVKAIAKAYGQDPDEVLKWKYGKVFGILYTDLEEYKFQMKLQKQYAETAKRGNYTGNNKR